MFEETKSLLYKCLERGSKLPAEEAVNGEVGGAVDDGAEPHDVEKYTGVGPNVERDAMLLKFKDKI